MPVENGRKNEAKIGNTHSRESAHKIHIHAQLSLSPSLTHILSISLSLTRTHSSHKALYSLSLSPPSFSLLKTLHISNARQTIFTVIQKLRERERDNVSILFSEYPSLYLSLSPLQFAATVSPQLLFK